jgi:hypothetical protein
MAKTAEEAHKEVLGVFFNKDSEGHKAFFDSGHILHHQIVNQVHEMTRVAIGDHSISDKAAVTAREDGGTTIVYDDGVTICSRSGGANQQAKEV